MTEAQRIYKELKQDVVTCTLAPGLSVSEQDICTRYHASRTPVREACRLLCNESLMQMIPFRGYSVTSLTIEEYRNLYELQIVVEPAVAALAAERATQEQLKEIEFWASYEYHPGQKNSYYTFLEWNRNFHICIAAASKNQALLDIVTNAQTRLMRYYYLVIVMDSYGQDLVDEHRELVKALRSGKAELARERATDHLTQTVKRTSKIDLRSVNLPSEMISAVNYADWLTPTSAGKRPRTSKPKKLIQL
jgi:DNA-binding GntR family transcriptional regulator